MCRLLSGKGCIRFEWTGCFRETGALISLLLNPILCVVMRRSLLTAEHICICQTLRFDCSTFIHFYQYRRVECDEADHCCLKCLLSVFWTAGVHRALVCVAVWLFLLLAFNDRVLLSTRFIQTANVGIGTSSKPAYLSAWPRNMLCKCIKMLYITLSSLWNTHSPWFWTLLALTGVFV